MVKLDRMSYEELIKLKAQLDARIKEFRPIRVKKKWKRCGKRSCFCADGPADNEWNNLHGPYLFAQFVCPKLGKTKTVSLGNFYDLNDIDEVRKQILDWGAYFNVPGPEYDKMSVDDQRRYNWRKTLTSYEFEQFYGVSVGDDRFGRHKTFYATLANSDAYDQKLREIEAEREATDHPWADQYGLCDPVGQKKLSQLLTGAYYLVK